MKRWKKLLVSLLTVSMTIGASTMSVMAADGYTYKVTLSAGNKGTINGQDKIEKADLFSGSIVTFNLNAVQVTDDKYYVKGIRLSGRDNSEALAAPAFRVNGDADYVVAYGIKGDMVAYTVNYEDEQGNKLAESQTFYGNVGDKPVVAYRYTENYVPQALALTKTLSDNEAENVFTFKYAPGATNRVVETVNHVTVVIPGNTITNTVTIPAGTTGTTGGNGTGANGTNGTGANGTTRTNGTGTNADGTTTPGGTDANGGQDADQNGTVENPDEQTPQDQINLDDEDTPTGNIDAGKETQDKNKTLGVSIAIIVAAVVALIALFVAMKRRKKETK